MQGKGTDRFKPACADIVWPCDGYFTAWRSPSALKGLLQNRRRDQ